MLNWSKIKWCLFYWNTLSDSSSKHATTRSPQALLWASNLPLHPLFGGWGGIQINIFVWYIKRDPYNMLIELLIATSLTPYRLLMPPHLLLSDSSLTPKRPYITKWIRVILDFPAIFSMNKVDVKVYIFPPFFEIVDRMCIGIYFRYIWLNCWFSFAPVVRHPRDLQVSVTTRCFCRVLIFVSS